MNVEKYFNIAFGVKCLMTTHSLQRLNQRFLFTELERLKLLVQAGVKALPLDRWNDTGTTVIVDKRFNFGIVASLDNDRKAVRVITFIRGKEPDSYKNCTTIEVSLLKEKADQEAIELNQHRLKMKK